MDGAGDGGGGGSTLGSGKSRSRNKVEQHLGHGIPCRSRFPLDSAAGKLACLVEPPGFQAGTTDWRRAGSPSILVRRSQDRHRGELVSPRGLVYPLPAPLPESDRRRLGPGWSLSGFPRRGRFQLQLSRRRKKTVLSLRQVRELEVGGTAQARIGAATAVRLSRISSRRPQLDRYAIQPLSQPLIQQANRRLSNAVVRRLQTSLSIELSRKRGQTRLFRVEWQSHQEQSVRFAYQYLLGGRLPSPLPGVRISGVFESVRQKSLRVALNVFDWMILRGEKSTRRIERASLTPDGHLIPWKDSGRHEGAGSWHRSCSGISRSEKGSRRISDGVLHERVVLTGDGCANGCAWDFTRAFSTRPPSRAGSVFLCDSVSCSSASTREPAYYGFAGPAGKIGG